MVPGNGLIMYSVCNHRIIDYVSGKFSDGLRVFTGPASVSLKLTKALCIQVRPAMSKGLGLKGSFRDGPWSYRICSIVIMTPLYATLLVCVGTVFGRHAYFRHFAVKMFSRFGIPPELMDSTFHETAKNFRKW